MECYKCGAVLSDSDFCHKCGADVKLYKKILKSSDAYYNQGLSRAQERDLSGAAECLRQSVKLNKHNTQARNLLGLVYFEMGEAVAALSQWVISKNLQPEKNIADTYLNAIQKNAGRLDTINQTIKKYNQALNYAKQDSADLAIIQLKKVLTLNPNLVKGHQLLALLYMKNGEPEKAVKPLKKALAIDKCNPLTLKYMKEIRDQNEPPEKKGGQTKPAAERSSVSGDDVIIPKTNYRESNAGGITVLNVVIGIAIGAALMWFLVFPSKEKMLAEENNRKQLEISEQLEQKNSVITGLETEKKALEAEKQKLEADLDAYKGKDGVIAAYQEILNAVNAYLAEDYITAAQVLVAMDQTVIQTEAFAGVYTVMLQDAGTRAVNELYDDGYDAYAIGDYETSKELLNKAHEINPDHTGTLYYLGRSYQRLGDSETGRKYLQQIIDRFPNDHYYQYAKQYIDR
ncbi:MAG: tetratricopeptide repeat protein [Lachnospiraceae bacterium]|nr:tetratricopeptide repeat protein [Lachnospiraceae bacterium]